MLLSLWKIYDITSLMYFNFAKFVPWRGGSLIYFQQIQFAEYFNYFMWNKLYKWFTIRVESPYTMNIHKVSAIDMVFFRRNIDGKHWAICGYLFSSECWDKDFHESNESFWIWKGNKIVTTKLIPCSKPFLSIFL